MKQLLRMNSHTRPHPTGELMRAPTRNPAHQRATPQLTIARNPAHQRAIHHRATPRTTAQHRATPQLARGATVHHRARRARIIARVPSPLHSARVLPRKFRVAVVRKNALRMA
jgi:hypothetical protein